MSPVQWASAAAKTWRSCCWMPVWRWGKMHPEAGTLLKTSLTLTSRWSRICVKEQQFWSFKEQILPHITRTFCCRYPTNWFNLFLTGTLRTGTKPGILCLPDWLTSNFFLFFLATTTTALLQTEDLTAESFQWHNKWKELYQAISFHPHYIDRWSARTQYTCTLIMITEAGRNVGIATFATSTSLLPRGQTKETDWNTNQRQTLAVFMLTLWCVDSNCSWGNMWMTSCDRDGGATRILDEWLEGTCWLWTLTYTQGGWGLCVLCVSLLSQPFYLPRVFFFSQLHSDVEVPQPSALACTSSLPESQVCFTECQRAKHLFQLWFTVIVDAPRLRLGHHIRLSVVVSLSILPHLQSSTGTTGTLCHLICQLLFFFFQLL